MAPTRKSSKIKQAMKEYKKGTLHSGSEHGPRVKSRKQAVAIGLSQARKAGEQVTPRRKSRKSPESED